MHTSTSWLELWSNTVSLSPRTDSSPHTPTDLQSFGSSSSFMAPYFQNQTCDPYTPRDRPCVLGNYASYAIDVSSADDVLAGLMFAAKTNVRVTVKNTGHE